MSEENYHCRPDSDQPQPQGGIITDAAREAACAAFPELRTGLSDDHALLVRIMRVLDAATAELRADKESMRMLKDEVLKSWYGCAEQLAAKDREIAELRLKAADREGLAERCEERIAEAVAKVQAVCAERDQLRAEVERLKKDNTDFAQWIACKMVQPEWDSFKKSLEVIDHWKARAEKAEAQLAAAQEDSKRLDWLENQQGESLETLHLSRCSSGMGGSWFKKQIRAAIDAAREGGDK